VLRPRTSWRAIALVSVAALSGAVLSTSLARADEPAVCATESARPPGSIIVPMTVLAGGPVGVTIVEGETLCVAGPVERDGSMPKVGLSDAAQPEPYRVALRFDPAGPLRELSVRATPARWLAFSVGVVAPDGQVKSLGRWEIPPAGRYFPAPDPSIQVVVLYDFAFETPPAPPPRPRSPRPPAVSDRNYEWALALWGGFRRFQSLQGLDKSLHASGYGSFSDRMPSLGGAMDIGVHRWRFQLAVTDDWTSASGPAGAAVHANLLELRAAAGYDFLRWRGLTGFALLGIGGASFTMDARAPNWDYLGSRASALGNPSSILRDAGLLTVQAGFEEIVPLGQVQAPSRGLLFSLQGGYTRQLGLGDWFTSGQGHVADPIDLDFSGGWITFGAGMVLSGMGLF
jgi:hypothetical protein